MSNEEARQIVEDGLAQKKIQRQQRDEELDNQERLLRVTINDNHQDAKKAEAEKQQKLMDDARKQREARAKAREVRAAMDMQAEQAANAFLAVCLVILLIAAITRLNLFVMLALVLGLAVDTAVYIYRLYNPIKEVKRNGIRKSSL
jgi:Flp pilus assembly protein TadB